MLVGQNYTLVLDLLTPGLTDVTFEIKKPSGESFVETALEEGDFTEAGYGYYNILIRKELVDQLGTYVFRISGYELEVFEEKECGPVPLSSAVPPDVCVVMGNIRNASALVEAFANVHVTAKPLKLPLEIGGTMMLGKRVLTYTDHSGFFQLPLVKGMVALIEIPDAGVRFQATIPDVDTVRIEDIIP